MTLSTTLLGLFLCVSLGSCCFDPCLGSSTIASTGFVFDSDTLAGRGFRQTEIRSLYVVQYSDNRLTRPIDTLRSAPAAQPQLVLFDKRRIQLLFTGDSSSRLPSYFRIVLPNANLHFDIQQVTITLKTSEQCRTTCQDVTGVSFTLNGRPTTVLGAYTGAEGAVKLSK
ncbi:hypothetical protein FNT36_05915 [Hymenobacter setariae]|uniref:Lipoprotein n=1 Tax=Hymenobacter setariae TaxID=2594794 RepID=A0A558C4B8_9BACT|nr:hypothetical protein [Hymenobacter setariae]TVT43618.1 hypothetical protein FNT36_05915 [Hymenobacter setariae]